MVFNHIEQTTPDDPCEKYGSESVFINLNLKLLTQFSGSNFSHLFFSNVYFTAAKFNITTIIAILF